MFRKSDQILSSIIRYLHLFNNRDRSCIVVFSSDLENKQQLNHSNNIVEIQQKHMYS